MRLQENISKSVADSGFPGGVPSPEYGDGDTNLLLNKIFGIILMRTA